MAKSKAGRAERQAAALEYRQRRAELEAKLQAEAAAEAKENEKKRPASAVPKVRSAFPEASPYTAEPKKKKRKKAKKARKSKTNEEEVDNRPSFFEMAKANSANDDVDLTALQSEIEANQAKVTQRVAGTVIVHAASKPKTLEALKGPRMNGGTVYDRKDVRVMENFVDYLTEREKRRFLGAKKRKGKRPKAIKL